MDEQQKEYLRKCMNENNISDTTPQIRNEKNSGNANS